MSLVFLLRYHPLTGKKKKCIFYNVIQGLAKSSSIVVTKITHYALSENRGSQETPVTELLLLLLSAEPRKSPKPNGVYRNFPSVVVE